MEAPKEVIELVERYDRNSFTNKVQLIPTSLLSKKQIGIADKQIDQLVYQLYGLTEEEIKLVEGE